MPAYLARIGVTVFAMLFAIALVTEHQAAGRALVASANGDAPVASIPPAAVVTGPVAFDEPEVPAAAPVIEAPVVEPPVVVAPVAVVAVTAPAPPAAPAATVVNADGIVLASWYGPGFYGNRTACGQVYTPEIIGVAHKTLPCGTLLTLTYGSRVLTVPVIDRGPYVAGRTLDLSYATKLAIGCTDLCTLRMQIGR